MRARVGDELIQDTLGNMALVRDVKRQVRMIVEYRLVKELNVCVIVSKIAFPVKRPAFKAHWNGNGTEHEDSKIDLSGIIPYGDTNAEILLRSILPEEWIKRWRESTRTLKATA